MGCDDTNANDTNPTVTLVIPTSTATALPPTATATTLPSPTNILDAPTPQPSFVAPSLNLPTGFETVASAIQADEALANARIISAKTVTWDRAELSCASRDIEQERRIDGFPGFRLVLQTDEALRVYFANDTGDILYCEDAPPLYPYGEVIMLDPVAGELVDLARADLARRLEVAGAAIRLVDLVSVEWLESSFGCPQPETSYTTRQTNGHRIVLRHAGTDYAYHTDAFRVFLCPDGLEQLPALFG